MTWKERADSAIDTMQKNVASGLNMTRGASPDQSARWGIWARHSTECTCPGCGEQVSYFGAAGEIEASYDPNDHPEKFECPHCESELLYVVPLMALTPAGWKWDLAVWPATGKRKG